MNTTLFRCLPSLIPLLCCAHQADGGRVSLEYRNDYPDRVQAAVEFHAALRPAVKRTATPTITAAGGAVSDVYTSPDYSDCVFTVTARPTNRQRPGSVLVKFATGNETTGVSCPLQFYPVGAVSVGDRPLRKTNEFLVGGVENDCPADRLRSKASTVEIFAVNESADDVRMGSEYDLLVGCPVGVKGIRFKSIACDQGACGAGPDNLASWGWMHLWYRPWDKNQHLPGGIAHIKVTFSQRHLIHSSLTRTIIVAVDPDGTSRLSPRLPRASVFQAPAYAPLWQSAPTSPL